MMVTFLSKARSKATKRPSRRIRPVARETPVEVDRERGTTCGVFVTLTMLARHELNGSPEQDCSHEIRLTRQFQKICDLDLCSGLGLRAEKSPASGDGYSPESERSSHSMGGAS